MKTLRTIATSLILSTAFLTGQAHAAGQSEKWKYEMVDGTCNNININSCDAINKAGNNGWELVQIVILPTYGGNRQFAYMKKRLSN